MLLQLTLGAILVVLNAVMHIAALDQIATQVRGVVTAEERALRTRERLSHPAHLRQPGDRLEGQALRARVRLGLLIFAALGTLASHILQIWIWAWVYLLVGEFGALEPALYFSTVVFTTLGFGDITASPEWRLMAACEAAAGMLLFGLSTAFLFEMLREVLRRGPARPPGV